MDNFTISHLNVVTTVAMTTFPTAWRSEVSTTPESSGKLTDTERHVVITVLVILSLVGTFGNALTIYVFSNLKQKVTSTIFILTLAGTDFITCLITIPFTIAMESIDHWVSVDLICKVYHFLITTTVPFSCVVIVAIAVDRYMCICHPFYHWMTVRKARIIIGVLAFIIFIFGGLICMHYSIYTWGETSNSTKLSSSDNPGTTANASLDLAEFIQAPNTSLTLTESPNSSLTFNQATDASFTVSLALNSSLAASISSNVSLPISSDVPQDLDWVFNPETSFTSAPPSNWTRRANIYIARQCDKDPEFISEVFFSAFRHVYTGIFLTSCIVVLVLYSLIYRSVIARRKKKLRIRSAHCCLLWNSASIDATFQEIAEMTQDIELSHVDGDDRYMTRQISGHTSSGANELSEPHNNGHVVRKCSLSKARIERMCAANIKTAFTLFVVTLVFILAFLPSWLMALQIVEMNVIVFYLHYVYNVVNPLIYAFLNQNFKTELRKIFRCNIR